MGFKLENQKRQTFYTTQPNLPLIDVSIGEDEYVQQLKAHTFELLVRPLFTPDNSGKQGRIVDESTNGEIAPVTFTEALLHYLRTDVLDQELTGQLKNLYAQGSEHSLKSQMSFDQFLAMEALSKESLPYPQTGQVIYTPGELRDAADDLHTELNKATSNKIDALRTTWFAKLSAYVSQFHLSNFRLITVKNHRDFDDLIKNMVNYVKQNITLPNDTARHLTQFHSMTMD